MPFRISPLARRLATRLGMTKYAREILRTARTPADEITLHVSADTLLQDDIASIHCHSTTDLLGVHNALTRAGRRGSVVLVLTSHSPEMPGREAASALRAAGAGQGMCRTAEERLVSLDKAAFTLADALLFPCLEATEPYVAEWDGFQAILQSQHVAYAPTGIEYGAPVERRERGSRFRIGFVGRHNSVKGYDLLQAATKRLCDAGSIEVVCAGNAGPIPAPVHEAWSEMGRIPGPHALFAKVDAVVLPNRQTYFDIMALETMAAGLPLLASATGGNRHLARSSRGIIAFEPTLEDLDASITALLAIPTDEVRSLGEANRNTYLSEYTSERFASRYREAIENLVRDAATAS